MSRILYIDPFLPLHDRASGSLRTLRILELLKADGHHIAYMPHTIWAGQEKYGHDLMQMGIEVLAPPSGTHTDVSVTAALAGKTFDIVVISFYKFAASYGPFIRSVCPDARVIVDTIDLHFVRERRQAQSTGDAELAAKAEQTHDEEIATYKAADALIAISDVEKKTLESEIPGATVYVVPNVHEVADRGPGYETRNGLLFVGNFWHPPNSEGIVWFCNEVWPRVIRRVPAMTLDVVGQDPPSELTRFIGNSVRVHGWVQSIQPFFQNSRLSIAPLLHGAGLKGKVGEALAHGLPVVTTSIGAEGLGLMDSKSAMIADGAEAFADAIVTAHQSPELWERLRDNGRDVINHSFTPDAVRAAVREVVPPPEGRNVSYFGIPDWNDADTLESVTRTYLERHNSARNSTLHLGVIDTDINDAFTKLSNIIVGLGFDPENIADISLTPLESPEMGFLKPDTVWVPMRNDVAKPDHVLTQVDLAAAL